MAWLVDNFYKVGAIFSVFMFVVLFAVDSHTIHELRVGQEQLKRAAAMSKIDVITEQMNVREIEQQRHELEVDLAGVKKNLALAKKIMHDYGMQKDKELHEEIVRPRPTAPLPATSALPE